MAQQEQTNITYEEYVLPYKDKFILVNIPQERIDNIIKLTESLIKLMDYEQQYKIDTKELYNKIYCNLLAEAACEIILDIPIILWYTNSLLKEYVKCCTTTERIANPLILSIHSKRCIVILSYLLSN